MLHQNLHTPQNQIPKHPFWEGIYFINFPTDFFLISSVRKFLVGLQESLKFHSNSPISRLISWRNKFPEISWEPCPQFFFRSKNLIPKKNLPVLPQVAVNLTLNLKTPETSNPVASKLCYFPSEPRSKILVLGMVIQPLIGNPYNGYINPYY